MAISQSIERACRRYEEVQAEGLTLYPILVEEMETFELARPGIDIVQQSLPVAYAVMPLLAAYYKMEYDAMERGEETVGLLSRALLMLALSLRLGRGKALDERLKAFRCKVDTKDPSRLTAVEFVLHGEELWRITPVQFQYLREIIAAQNGIELTPPEANPELVEAQRELAEMNGGAKLSGDLWERVATVAALEHAEEEDIESWPVLKLQTKAKTWQRILGYMTCTIAEARGTQWKRGNPWPSLFYDRVSEGNTALRPVEESTRGMGQA